MCAFPASGQPPTVIFYIRSTARAVNRAPQQGLGVQQRPEPHCQAAVSAVGCARAVADGNGIPGSRNLRLNHLFPLSVNGEVFGEFRDTQPLRQASCHRNAMCRQAFAGTARTKTLPHAS
jgi:hypothetical protein